MTAIVGKKNHQEFKCHFPCEYSINMYGDSEQTHDIGMTGKAIPGGTGCWAAGMT